MEHFFVQIVPSCACHEPWNDAKRQCRSDPVSLVRVPSQSAQRPLSKNRRFLTSPHIFRLSDTFAALEYPPATLSYFSPFKPIHDLWDSSGSVSALFLSISLNNSPINPNQLEVARTHQPPHQTRHISTMPPSDPDPTLSLPRILCLHGGGVNS